MVPSSGVMRTFAAASVESGNPEKARKLMALENQSCTPVTAYCIYFLDEDYTGGIFLSLIKQIPDPGGSYSYEHLHKI